MRTGQAWAFNAAPAVFVLLWSTGFVGAKYGLPYAQPFTFLAIRLFLASALLALLALVLRTPAPRGRVQWGRSAVTGVLLHAAYLGGVFWAISRGFPAGVSSVVVSLQPVLVAALAGTVLGETLRRVQWAGLVLGVVGVGLVLAPGLAATDGVPVSGLVSCLLALVAGTAGTLHQKRHGAGIPLLGGTAAQYAAAGVLLGLLALARKQAGLPGSDVLVATVMSNLGLLQAMRAAGIEVLQTAVGDRYVLAAMLAGGHRLGGEQSGHVVFRDYATTGDGLLTALQVMDRVVRTGRSLAELAAGITLLPQVLVNVGADRSRANDDDVLAAVAAERAALAGGGRVLLRPSGTEALVRVMVEAPTAALADQVAARLAAVVAG